MTSFFARGRGSEGGRLRTSLAVAVAAGALSAGIAGASLAGAAARPAAPAVTGKKAVVVEVVTRGKYGKMLASAKVGTQGAGYSLYEKPKGGCTGSCLDVWPPLRMPKGATIPEGISGLGTVTITIGKTKVVQVTYDKQPLYMYYDDGPGSVSGAGIKGWVVAQVK
jgi:predicted lipoprotein with Yx(FWY)xxD motif